MTFQPYFQKSHSSNPGLFINARGLAIFGAASIKQFGLSAPGYVSLYYCQESGRIGLQMHGENRIAGAAKICKGHNSLVVCVKGFARANNIQPGRYSIALDESLGMLVCERREESP